MSKKSRYKIYEGTTKILYSDDQSEILTQFFKDDVVLGQEVLHLSGKGVINNTISSKIMQGLELVGIPTHFIKKINMREQNILPADVLPIQICISNVAAGRYKNLGIEDGFIFETPQIDFRFRKKSLGYPSVNEEQIYNFGWLTKEDLDDLKSLSYKVNMFVSGFFAAINLRLVEIKLEFGISFKTDVYSFVITDEISLDTCKIWDMESNQKFGYEAINMDKKIGISCYEQVVQRL